MKLLFIFFSIFLSLNLKAQASRSTSHTDIRFHKIDCDARWYFDRYIKCLNKRGLIPAVREAYFTQEGKKRFYKISKQEGAGHCSQFQENKHSFQTCINRFVAHKAQMLGTSETNDFDYIDKLEDVSAVKENNGGSAIE